MITPSDIPVMLLNACPSANEAYQDHLKEWDDEPAYYIDIGIFTNHIINSFKNNSFSEFPDLFNVLETLL